MYRKIVKVDFFILYDYYCLNICLFGVCELVVYDIVEVKYECDMEEECMVFVLMEMKLWMGK